MNGTLRLSTTVHLLHTGLFWYTAFEEIHVEESIVGFHPSAVGSVLRVGGCVKQNPKYFVVFVVVLMLVSTFYVFPEFPDVSCVSVVSHFLYVVVCGVHFPLVSVVFVSIVFD